MSCLTEVFFSEAIARSRALDQERLNDLGATLRTLHGLPTSLKYSFRVPGVDSTIGLTLFVGQPDIEHSALAALLLDLGAVLYCQTNVSETMMIC